MRVQLHLLQRASSNFNNIAARWHDQNDVLITEAPLVIVVLPIYSYL
jgi:hypothetical protein